MNFARRLEKLEATCRPLDADGIGTMNDEELRAYVATTLQNLGGKAEALAALRTDPATDPDTLMMVEDWPAWLL